MYFKTFRISWSTELFINLSCTGKFYLSSYIFTRKSFCLEHFWIVPREVNINVVIGFFRRVRHTVRHILTSCWSTIGQLNVNLVISCVNSPQKLVFLESVPYLSLKKVPYLTLNRKMANKGLSKSPLFDPFLKNGGVPYLEFPLYC